MFIRFNFTPFVCLSVLASGSDDVAAILWDPYQKRAVATMHTGHTGNIFSVKVRPV